MASVGMLQQDHHHHQQQQQQQQQQVLLPPSAPVAAQPAAQQRPQAAAAAAGQPLPCSLRDMLRVSGGLTQPSSSALYAAWWLDDSTLHFIAKLHRLNERLVLTVDAEPVTLSFDQVRPGCAACV